MWGIKCTAQNSYFHASYCTKKFFLRFYYCIFNFLSELLKYHSFMTKPVIHPGNGGKGEEFYKEFLQILSKTKIPFIISGTYALRYYTGINRPTKDIDIFCQAGDYPRILKVFSKKGYKVEITDERWLAKIYKGNWFVDIIFGSVPGFWPITEKWMESAPLGDVIGLKVHITPPEELIVSKAYRMDRRNFDGADVVNLILKCGAKLDWERILRRMEPYWEVLLVHILLFRFIYPSDRHIVPKWLITELVNRVKSQLDLPEPKEKVCRGSLLSHDQYDIAYSKWGYNDFTKFIPLD